MAPTKTSSPNKYVFCDHCGARYSYKRALKTHVKKCLFNRTRTSYDETFESRGNLLKHSQQKQGEVRQIPKRAHIYECTGCTKIFKHSRLLRYHIREQHFNMITMTTDYETRNVKDVWYERVLNSDDLVQVTKTGPHRYLMKRTKDLGFLKCAPKHLVDLSALYPSRCKYCKICKKNIPMCIKAHLKSTHPEVDVDRLYSHVSELWEKQRQNVTSETIIID